MTEKFLTLTLKAIAALITLLIPLYPVLGTMLMLIFADFVTGVWSSYNMGYPITARRMQDTVGKIVLYLFAILCAYFTEQHIVPEIPLLRPVSGFIALTELKSVLENVGKIRGIDIISHIKDRFKDFFNKH